MPGWVNGPQRLVSVSAEEGQMKQLTSTSDSAQGKVDSMPMIYLSVR